MKLQEQNFIELLRASIHPGTQPELKDPSYPEIIKLGESHGVTGLLYPGLKRCLPFDDPFLARMKKQSFAAATRESMQGKDLERIFSACQEAKIPILPLKGCVIKKLYPYPELRFMSDADLLIPGEFEENIKGILKNSGFQPRKVDAGDTLFYVSPVSLNYEIHLDLQSEGYSHKTCNFTGNLLKLARPVAEGSYVMELPPEEHYVYILCHFIKHFVYGGVGIRQLTDLYICYYRWDLDLKRVEHLVEELELTEFHQNLLELCATLFQGRESSPKTAVLGEYILRSGVFGTEEQRATDRILAVRQEKTYIWGRLFPSYKTMKGYFPILKKMPILLPFAWVWRAVRALLFRRDKLNTEINVLSNTDRTALDEKRQFFHDCGLTVYEKK